MEDIIAVYCKKNIPQPKLLLLRFWYILKINKLVSQYFPLHIQLYHLADNPILYKLFRAY